MRSSDSLKCQFELTQPRGCCNIFYLWMDLWQLPGIGLVFSGLGGCEEGGACSGCVPGAGHVVFKCSCCVLCLQI